MPLIPDTDKARIRRHLGYIERTDPVTGRVFSAVPNGYLVLFKRAIDLDYRADDIVTIQQLLNELDTLRPQRLPHNQADGIGYRRLITGDTNRTDIEYRPESLRARKRAYIDLGDELCNLLGIPYNFKDPANEHLLNRDVLYPAL